MTTVSIDLLRQRLAEPLPGWRVQARFAPELSFGRHFGPPPPDARDAAVLVLLYQAQGQWQIPLILRPTELTDHGGQIGLPGGRVEPGEASHIGALRELEEELGVRSSEIKLLGALSPVYISHTNYRVQPWVAVAAAPPEWNINRAEVDEMLTLPTHLLEDASAHSHRRVERYGISSVAPCLMWRRHRIWGTTHMILQELAQLLRPRAEGS